MRYKSYDHLHLKSSISQNNARLSLATILHTSSWTILNYISIQKKKYIIIINKHKKIIYIKK